MVWAGDTTDASHASASPCPATQQSALLAQRKSVGLRPRMRAFDSPRGLQHFLPREADSGWFPKSAGPGSTPGRGPTRRGRSAARMPACHAGDRGASPLRGSSMATPTRMDGRVAYGGGLLNRRGRAVLRWFESSSIPQQSFSPFRPGRQSRVIGRASGASRKAACSSHARPRGGSSVKGFPWRQHARPHCRRSSSGRAHAF
jgi:hypothetical protein